MQGPREVKRHRRPAPALQTCRLMFDSFAETPLGTLNQLIFANVAHRINPRCTFECCTLHASLTFLRRHLRHTSETIKCKNWGSDKKVQCLDCLCLQMLEGDSTAFTCELCGGEEIRPQDILESAVSSGGQADDESSASEACESDHGC